MQVTHPCLRLRALSVCSALLLGLCATSATAGVAPTTDFRPDYHRPARVTCPSDSALPRPLISAAACGDLHRVRARIAEGADVSVTDARPQLLGRTALHHATQQRNADTVALLLEASADPNAVDANGNTALHLLAMARPSADSAAIAERLIAAGADARLRNTRKRTALEEFTLTERYSVDPLRIKLDALRTVLARAETDGPVAVTRSAPAISEMPAEPPVVEVAADSAAAAPAASPAVEPPPATALETKPVPTVDAKGEVKPAAAAEKAPEPPAPAPVAEDPSRAVRAAVAAWADAWSARNVDAYLAHYAKAFKPASGQTVERWKAQRRDRVGKPESITVALSDLSVSIDGNRAVVKFEQDYRSDDFKVVDRKTLVMVREGQNWKIVEEISGS